MTADEPPVEEVDMKIGILGTGQVARTLAGALLREGHEVTLGSRARGHEGAAAFVAEQSAAHEGRVHSGSFADAAAFGELLLLCTVGHGAVAAAESVAEQAAGKVLVDVTNPLDFSRGFPPTLFTPGDRSLGEQVQAAAPRARVVKTLNTVSCDVMVAPGRLAEPTDLFLCGDDAEAKQIVRGWLGESFGWERFVDLGGLDAARGTESWLPLWVRLYGTLGNADFNLRLVGAAS